MILKNHSIVDAIAIDGPALVHMNVPGKAVETFGHYCSQQIAEKLLSLSRGVLRVDIVFDVYRDLSLKQETRERRGTDGMRISLRKETPIQHKFFRKVIRVGENKTALFNMIADAIALVLCETIILSTRQSSVVSNIPLNCSRLQTCNREEADTRLFLHVKDASTNGIKIMIITVDTDVVVIALFVCCSLDVQELWIEFGSGKNKKWLHIHQYATIFGQEKCRALPFW